jgi:hypothetical protein
LGASFRGPSRARRASSSAQARFAGRRRLGRLVPWAEQRSSSLLLCSGPIRGPTAPWAPRSVGRATRVEAPLLRPDSRAVGALGASVRGAEQRASRLLCSGPIRPLGRAARVSALRHASAFRSRKNVIANHKFAVRPIARRLFGA